MAEGEIEESSTISVHKPSPAVPGSLEVHTRHCRNKRLITSNTFIGRGCNFLKQVANSPLFNVNWRFKNHTSNFPFIQVELLCYATPPFKWLLRTSGSERGSRMKSAWTLWI